ncbi:hypothetical protein L1D13_25070, partial [Vibrio tubiashii]
MAVDSLKIYNQLPEDLDTDISEIDISSDEALDRLIELQNSFVQSVLGNQTCEKDFEVLLSTMSFIQSCFRESINENISLNKLNEAKRINDTFIYLYRNYLKLERQGLGDFRLQKSVCQFLNYSFQNCISVFDRKEDLDRNISCLGNFELAEMDKPWDALIYQSYLYIID